jgi:hypothetical protein
MEIGRNKKSKQELQNEDLAPILLRIQFHILAINFVMQPSFMVKIYAYIMQNITKF